MSGLSVTGLTADDTREPLGLDVSAPRLAWSLHATGPGQRQTACQVLVAASPGALARDRGDVWDSGVLPGDVPGVRYAGPAPRTRTRYWWKARAFDRDGRPSAWSAPSWWETGLGPDDWGASWIGRRPSAAGAPVRQRDRGDPAWSRTGHTLGQSFTVPSAFAALSVWLAAERCTLSLRRGGPGGEELLRRSITAPRGDRFAQWVETGEPLPPGTYYVEVGDGDVCWWTCPDGRLPGGHAYADGVRVAGARTLSVETAADPSPLLRKVFTVPAEVASARLYAAGLGYHELFVNGRRVGARLLDPAPVDYDRRVPYDAHDVTSLLRSGANVIAAALGRGFYAMRTTNVWGWNTAPWNDEPKLRCRLEAFLRDGSTVTVVSDGTWRVTAGPTTRDSLYGGETHDARREPAGWTRPDHDDTGWRAADLLDPPRGEPVAQRLPPITVARTTPLTAPAVMADGSWVYDLGFATAGWARLEAEGPAGARVTLRYGERVRRDGGVEAVNEHVAGPVQTDVYVLAGSGREVWEPRFGYKGFRYVQVSAPPEVTVGRLLARSAHTAVEPAGGFRCSEELLAWIDRAAGATILNNLHGIPTDTPLYEKNGWTADGHLTAETAIHHFDMRLFFRKWLRDFADAQSPDGGIPLIVPTPGWGRIDDPCWSGAYPLIAWNLYEYYGDADVLDEHYEAIRRHVEHLHAVCGQAGGPWPGFSHGDWLPPGRMFAPEGPALAATAFTQFATRRLAQIAAVLGRSGDAARYEELAQRIADAFHGAFFDPDTAEYRTGAGYRQTANVLPLAFGLVPAGHRAAVARNLVRDIRRRGHLDTGVLGTKYLLPVLTEHGHADVAVDLALRRTYPSWGHWRERGARTFREGWDDDARSHDHHLLGSVSQWLREHVAGLRPAAPGFARIKVEPIVDERIRAAEVRYRSVRGDIAVSWRREPEETALDVTVPVGVTAEVRVPARPGDVVTGAGRPVDAASLTLTSGEYRLRARRP